ncbi:MAG: ATP-dependent sacrificial sulfur transferase LarE [Candidatus Sumerlaeota bacterium]
MSVNDRRSLSPELRSRYEKLLDWMRPHGRMAVGYSGGVDSSLVLRAACDALGRDNALGILIKSELVSGAELAVARKVAEDQGLPVEEVGFSALAVKEVASNPPDRCYFCKKGVFETIFEAARRQGYENVADGNTYEDLKDPHRPGMRAAEELGVLSPLLELEMEKPEIRRLSEALGLPNWSKPTEACLASRIPYETALTQERLTRVESAEKFLKEHDFEQVRVRHLGNKARIEVPADDIERLTAEPLRQMVETELTRLGFETIEVDPKGYRTGSMNEEL